MIENDEIVCPACGILYPDLGPRVKNENRHQIVFDCQDCGTRIAAWWSRRQWNMEEHEDDDDDGGAMVTV